MLTKAEVRGVKLRTDKEKRKTHSTKTTALVLSLPVEALNIVTSSFCRLEGVFRH